MFVMITQRMDLFERVIIGKFRYILVVYRRSIYVVKLVLLAQVASFLAIDVKVSFVSTITTTISASVCTNVIN